MQIIQESPNLYRLTRFHMVNCFLVREDDGCTLVDTNIQGSCDSILHTSRSLAWPIRRIVLTHAHFDHVASLDQLSKALPEAEVAISAREACILQGDFSLDEGERGKRLFGFFRARAKLARTLGDGEQIGSLQAISTPGHTPGHFAYLDVRDHTLIAGDAFTTQTGLVAAGVFSWKFPFPALFSWNAELSVQSASKLRALKPNRLAVGHGKTLISPLDEMDRAVEVALRQHRIAAHE